MRPLARTYRGQVLEATPPDHTETWTITTHQGKVRVEIRAAFWKHLVLSTGKPGDPTFQCIAIYDPRYPKPLLLAVDMDWDAETARQFYLDRWVVEQAPLAAKQMIGASRQFVFAPQSCQRLPALAMLAGSILSYVAATTPAVRTGYWDKKPHAPPGRLRRVLSKVQIEDWGELPAEVRQKKSPTAHLPKGIAAHRRAKAALAVPQGPQAIPQAA